MLKRCRYFLVWFFVCCALLVPAGKAEAAKTVKGTCYYDQAYQVLDIVNQERQKAGVGALSMDQSLLETAMLRAAECVVSFDHTRPNGQLCFTANSKMYGENIAMGFSSPAAVMKCWMNSPGHKSNILNSGFTSIGIGCFKYNGTLYWTQCFGFSAADAAANPGNCKRTYQVGLSDKEDTVAVSSEKIDPLAKKVEGVKAIGGKGKLTLKWSAKAGISGYQIQLSTNKKFKKAQTYKAGRKTVKKTLKKYNKKKLQSKKWYYVRIRAYIDEKDGSGNTVRRCGKWKQLKVKTK